MTASGASAVGIGALCVAAGFLCGSVPFGAIFARLRGIDLQKTGSGNIGATNAARALGKPIGVLVLLCDAVKAYGPVWATTRLVSPAPSGDWIACGVGFAAVLGHVFSPWLRFRGGKGVASSLGVFLAVAPLGAALGAALWVALYAATRISSVGSLAATAGVAAYMVGTHAPFAQLWLVGALLVLILFTHRDNIRRLLKKEESKV